MLFIFLFLISSSGNNSPIVVCELIAPKIADDIACNIKSPSLWAIIPYIELQISYPPRISDYLIYFIK